ILRRLAASEKLLVSATLANIASEFRSIIVAPDDVLHRRSLLFYGPFCGSVGGSRLAGVPRVVLIASHLFLCRRAPGAVRSLFSSSLGRTCRRLAGSFGVVAAILLGVFPIFAIAVAGDGRVVVASKIDTEG